MKHYILRGTEILSEIETDDKAVMALPSDHFVIAQAVLDMISVKFNVTEEQIIQVFGLTDRRDESLDVSDSIGLRDV